MTFYTFLHYNMQALIVQYLFYLMVYLNMKATIKKPF